MAFKTLEEFNESRYGGMFRLINDRDYADVIFLYQKYTDVLQGDTHYIKSDIYDGYVHCLGRSTGCPACAKNIKVQPKVFIPMYVISINDVMVGEIQYFDRTPSFEPQIRSDIFDRYSNPSEFIFRITRNGLPRDVNTKYNIMAIGNNAVKSYAEILADNNTSMPAHYEHVCKSVDAATLQSYLVGPVTNYSTPSELPNYNITPRVSVPVAAAPQVSMNLDNIDNSNTFEGLDDNEEVTF